MSEDASGERKALRQARRRTEILAAAAEEFAAVGYHEASLRRIGERVGLSKASLYYYVSSKSELLAELLAEETESQPIEVEQGEPAERLRTFVHTHLDRVLNTVAGRSLAENSAVLMSKSAEPSLIEARRNYEVVLMSILQAGIDSGQFRDVPLRPAVKFIFGGLNSLPQWYESDGNLPLDRMVDQIMAILLDGFLAE
ncbi:MULTISPECIES: TetR family transcriptional regulator [Rhodococcus]|uniref:TetR family transcriptional regulator n=1 Tax=Rhodococcus TaxID=1827 RepID=UPI00101EE287|nr:MULTISPECIES: TetR family transcriptional regulator [Rhodococcus]UTT51113.1 TetR/AcrR family transcriptional regulator [Rhodococcus gordoniae]